MKSVCFTNAKQNMFCSICFCGGRVIASLGLILSEVGGNILDSLYNILDCRSEIMEVTYQTAML